jgi:hypothetical protein
MLVYAGNYYSKKKIRYVREQRTWKMAPRDSEQKTTIALMQLQEKQY